MSETLIKISEEVLSTSVPGATGGEIAVIIRGKATAEDKVTKKINLVTSVSEFNLLYGSNVEDTDLSVVYARYLLRRGCFLQIGTVKAAGSGETVDYSTVVALLSSREVRFAYLLDLTQFSAESVAATFVSVLTAREGDFSIILASDTSTNAASDESKLKSTYDAYGSGDAQYCALQYMELVYPSVIMPSSAFLGSAPSSLVVTDTMTVPASIPYAERLCKLAQRSLYWKAAAGIVNGVLTNVIDVSEALSDEAVTAGQRLGLIPIITKLSVGVVAWGNATLAGYSGQAQDVLTETGVRHLTNFVKQEVFTISQRYMFEPNIEATWNDWKNTVAPMFRNLYESTALNEPARILMDRTTMSAEDINNGILRGQITFWPTRAITKIYVAFTIDESGVTFE